SGRQRDPQCFRFCVLFWASRGHHLCKLVPCRLYDVRFGGVQVRASQGRRGRDTGSYVDRGERREVRAWASRKPRERGDGVLATQSRRRKGGPSIWATLSSF